jgi:hypothetical protein
MYNKIDNEQLSQASPLGLDAAENGKVKTSINVLMEEAENRSGWSSELLSAAAAFLEKEVL